MKGILVGFCSLLLAFSMVACGSNENFNTPSIINNEQISLSSAESSEPTEQDPTEGEESASSSSDESDESTEQDPTEGEKSASSSFDENSESIEAISIENDIADQFIQITTGEGSKIVFRLNDSLAANNFYNQLPLSIQVEDYAGSEKIFYPSEKLDTNDAPLAQGPAGTLAYYAPWGNVAIFYGECGGGSGLYELGEAVTGTDFISTMTGEVKIEAIDASFALSKTMESKNTSAQQSQLSVPITVEPPETPAVQNSTSEIHPEESTTMDNATTKMNLQIGNSTFTATLEKNAAVDTFVELMKTEPIVIHMSDYSGFEKVGSLGSSLPASNSQTTTQSGDIVLYNGNQIVIFYGSNSWSYTRLGKIDDLTGWVEALGNGDITVTFSVE